MVSYEWDIESWFIDKSGEEEIYEHDHRDRLYEWPIDQLISAIHQDREPSPFEDKSIICFTRLVLVRDADEGRSWAYVSDDGKLPEYFLDAYDRPTVKVPKRFHDELSR